MSINEPESTEKSATELRARIGAIDVRQVQIWRHMSPAERLDIAFQAYQFALDTVRLTESQRAHGLSAEQLAWRVTRRMQGNQSLGHEYDELRAAD